MIAVGNSIPKKNILVSSGAAKSKVDLLEPCRMLDTKGYTIYGTHGTAKFLNDNGIKATAVCWPDVDWYTMPFAKSFSIFIPSLDRRAIALDPWKFETVADEFTTLGHEVGHCMTYSFYNRWAACDIKKKHENRADKWEIEQFLPLDALEAAAHEGCTEVWDLAERFGVTEDLVRKAICWYKLKKQ